jgi:uncharacterized repeat protein (TIGR01451 family)/fimbrial isopeptide formation D2 family protein
MRADKFIGESGLKIHHTNTSGRFLSVIGLIFLFVSNLAMAQVPIESNAGLPATPLIGEDVCIQVSFGNDGTKTGYGPYIIGIVEQDLIITSASFVDITPVREPIGIFGADGKLVDPISGKTITGTEGSKANIIRYPVGSLDPTPPILDLEFCGYVNVGAEIGVPLAVGIIPGFEFGDTPTGVNGAILGERADSTVTPQLVRINKSNTAPEGERPPGPSHVFDFILTVDISDQVSIEEVDISDTLSDSIQWTGSPISVISPLGVNCGVATNPNPPLNPGGTLTVQCDSITGTSSTNDLEIAIPVYITDILDETIPDSQVITNSVDLGYEFDGELDSVSDDNQVLAVHVGLQKTVNNESPLPGDLLTYTVNFQLTDFPLFARAGATDFVITDVLADGLAFDQTLDLTIDGVTIPISPTVTPGPVAGQTTVVWDVTGALGGIYENGGNGRLRYQADVLEYYSDNVTPVSGNDLLSNDINVEYTLSEGGAGDNGSSGPAVIQPNTTDKLFEPPVNPGELMPGQEVTFRLTMEIPSGKSKNVKFQDILPRPVFDVMDVNPAADVVVPAGFLPNVPVVSIIEGSNAIVLEYGDIVASVNSTLAVDITAQVTDEPYADDLFLTNLFLSSYENTKGDVIQGTQALGLTVGAPELQITKGVIDVDSNDVTITPPPPVDLTTALADSNASGLDAADVVTYAITIENIGGQSAYNVVIKDPSVPDLTCSASPDSVSDGDSNALTFTGDLVSGLQLTAPLPANDGAPGGGGAPFGLDAAFVIVQCTVDADVKPGQTIKNTASVEWTATAEAGSDFPEQTDDASIEIANPAMTKMVTNIVPGYSSNSLTASIGEIAFYQLDISIPEGVINDVLVEDVLNTGLAFIGVDSISATSGVSTDISGGFNAVLANAQFVAVGDGVNAPDRLLSLDFGNIQNTDTDNQVVEGITIIYQVKVLNSNANTTGAKRRNGAAFSWRDANGQRQTVDVVANPVLIAEPDLKITKKFSVATGDNTTMPTVSIRVEHSSASTADAFDLFLLDILPPFMKIADNSAVTVNCNNANTPVIPGNTPNGQIQATWDEFLIGDVCTLEFDVDFLINVPAGLVSNNCANIEWESLSSADETLAQSPNNTLGVERTGNASDPGQSNPYQSQSCDTFKILDVGITKSVFDSSQTSTDSIPGTPAETESLTIGEQVTFLLTVTLPLAPSEALVVSDFLPTTNMVLRLDSVDDPIIGADLSIPNASGLTISDTNGDGIDDKMEYDFGLVLHDIDSNQIIDDDDRIFIRVNATVLDRVANNNGDLDDNTAQSTTVPGGSDSDVYGIEIVEPVLQISKTANVSEVEAGDIITYSLNINHTNASRIDAQSVVINDVLPPQLKLVPGSLVTSRACSVPPDSLIEDGTSGVSVSWAVFPYRAFCEVAFQAEVQVNALINSAIVNGVTLDWISLDSSIDPLFRAYTEQSSWKVVVSSAGLTKEIILTSSDDTEFNLGAPSQDLTIGETVTFAVVVTLPDGTVRNAALEDFLPTNNVALEIIDASLASIGSDLTLSSGLQPGAPPDSCNANNTRCSWSVGDVVNVADNRPNPDPNDDLIFLITAIVLDDPLNSGAPADQNLTNLAEASSDQGILNALAAFSLVEPKLQLQKFTENGGKLQVVTANEEHTFTLRVSHLSDSSANARNLIITDILDSEMIWLADPEISSDCADWVLDSSPATGAAGGAVVFKIDTLALSDSSCEISFKVQMSPVLSLPGTFLNKAELTWESVPGSTESRSGSDSSEVELISFANATLSKEVTGTSVPQTGTGMGDPTLEDLTIGEIVEFELTAFFARGTISNIVLTDTLPSDPVSGTLAYVGAELIYIGNNLTVNQPTLDVLDNVFTATADSIENSGTGVLGDDDKLVVKIQAQVVDQPENVSGKVLRNVAELTYSATAGITESRSDFAEVELVEPQITLEKSFASLLDGVASIRLTANNPGDAPTFDIAVSDEFPEDKWLANSMVPVSVPPGFELSSNSAGGVTTVSLAIKNPGAVPTPQQILMPGQSAEVEFTMELLDGGILPGVTDILNTADIIGSSLPDNNNLEDAADNADQERVVTADARDTLQFPQLDLLKSWSGNNNPAKPGDVLTYVLTLNNSGSADAHNAVVIDAPDTIGDFQQGTVQAPGGIVVTGNSLGDTTVEVTFPVVAANGSVTVSYKVNVPLPYPDGMTAPQLLVNQATADSDESLQIDSDDPATSAIDDPTFAPVEADPVMLVTKDDQVLFSLPGSTVIYSINYGNAGDQDATGVVLTETVPDNTLFNAGASSSGWTCASTSPGSACTYTVGDLGGAKSGSVLFAVDIDDPVPQDVTRIFNSVGIAEDGIEFGTDVPSTPSTDSDDEETPLFASPELSILKSDGGISVVPGQVFAYTLIYRNGGNQTSTGNVITETVPDFTVFNASNSAPNNWVCAGGGGSGDTCTLEVGTLTSGRTKSALFGLQVVYPAPAGLELLNNTVSIKDDGANSIAPQVATASDDTPVIAVPDLTIEKSTDAVQVIQDQIVSYEIKYANVGNQNATGAVIREIVPPGAVYSVEGSMGTSWSCADGDPAGTVCEYVIGGFTAGDSGVINFGIMILAQPGGVLEIKNVIEINNDGTNGADPTPANNIDVVVTPFQIFAIPTLDRQMLLLLMVLMLGVGMSAIRRRSILRRSANTIRYTNV